MKLVFFTILALVFISCKSTIETKSSDNKISTADKVISQPSILIYKTRGNYNNKVPIVLSDDKSSIVSYPDPKDLKVGSNFLLPTLLNEGYLLDNKGIGKNVVFLKYTYQEYASLKNLPTLKQLQLEILDKNPLIELYNCGKKSNLKSNKDWLNSLIAKKALKTKCQKIK